MVLRIQEQHIERKQFVVGKTKICAHQVDQLPGFEWHTQPNYTGKSYQMLVQTFGEAFVRKSETFE